MYPVKVLLVSNLANAHDEINGASWDQIQLPKTKAFVGSWEKLFMSTSSQSCKLFANESNRDMKVLKLKDFLDWEPRCEDLSAEEGEGTCKVQQPSVVTWL